MTYRIAIFISGKGTNLYHLYMNIDKHNISQYSVCAIVSTKQKHPLYAFFNKKSIPIFITNKSLDHVTNEKNIHKFLCHHNIQLICLAGFMRVLSPYFVGLWKNKILNIHPSLLPKYPGINTHQKVLENRDIFHGATIHIVNECIDRGPIISQCIKKITHNECPQDLQKEILELEHILYTFTLFFLLQVKNNIFNKVIILKNKSIIYINNNTYFK